MKKRIFIGLAPLFLLLVLMGIYAVSLFAKLGNSVDVILRENFRSVVAGQQMKEAAERMDSALFFSLAGEGERGGKLYRQNLPVFREALTTELRNITLPGEKALADSVARMSAQYSERAGVFWQTSDNEARRRMYFQEMLPLFTRIKDTAQEIVRINQDNMVNADRSARALSEQSTRYMVLTVLAGLAGAAYFAHRLQRSILQPIQAVTAVSKELGDGKLDQVVPVESNDELGQLADAFNKLASKLRAYRQVTSDQILQARQMTEITFTAFPDPILVLSPEGAIDFANPAATRLLSKLDLQSALPAGVQAEVQRVLKGGEDYLPASFEKALCLRVGDHEAFLLPRIIGIRDDSGHVFGAAIILQDVTRLRLLDDVKTKLVSTVSHELKTPLTSVRMGLHLLLEERIGPLTSKQMELLLAARDDSERLLEMINDLLDLAKLESGEAGLPHLAMGARELVDNSAGSLREYVEARGLRLAVKTGPDLPKVAVDATQIAHVFSNFVSNAVKYTKRGEEIVIQAARCDGAVRFSVIDHGPGIPPEYQDRLFERFFRVPGSDTAGAGLGLAIAREVIAAHGGRIGVNSTPGQGSEFYFDLPAIPSESNL